MRVYFFEFTRLWIDRETGILLVMCYGDDGWEGKKEGAQDAKSYKGAIMVIHTTLGHVQKIVLPQRQLRTV